MYKDDWRKMKKYYLIILTVLFSTNSTARNVEPNLCQEKEHVYFSCATGEKIVSVCASKLSYPGYWYLTYRFGSLNNKTELEYTSTAKDFNDKFKFSYSGYSKGSTKELSFNISSYTYTLHEDRHVYRDDSAGVYVAKNGEIKKYFACNNSRVDDGSLYSLYDLKKEGFPVSKPSGIGTKAP